MTIIRFLRSTISTLNAAIAAASATKLHRMPDADALAKLGIRNADFRAINL